MNMKIEKIKIDKIQIDKIQLPELRTTNTNDLAFLQLFREIAMHGIVNPIIVRLDNNISNQYILVDGLQRLQIAKELGHTEIAATVLNIPESEIESTTAMCKILPGIHRVEAKPCAYSEALARLLKGSTVEDLAIKINKSGSWIHNRLLLNNIVNEHIRKLIDRGKIPLFQAYELAKLPEHMHKDKALEILADDN